MHYKRGCSTSCDWDTADSDPKPPAVERGEGAGCPSTRNTPPSWYCEPCILTDVDSSHCHVTRATSVVGVSSKVQVCSLNVYR